jgi:Fur family peroxide stress response transcriptional regulator
MQVLAYSNEQLGRKIRDAGLRPSSARICVLRYLEKHRDHPSADRIYRALKPELPSLSRASVYNSLAALERAGLIRPLSMSGGELRYDASVEDHGHFCCEICGEIHDFDVTRPDEAFGLEGFLVKRRDVLVWGVCPNCAEEKNA